MHSQDEWTHSNIETFGAVQFKVNKIKKKKFPDINYLIQYSIEDRLS